MMNRTVYDYTHERIGYGFNEKNPVVIEKETDYILSKVLASFAIFFQDKVVGIKVSNEQFTYTAEYLLSPTHKKNLITWLDRVYEINSPVSELDFGKWKIDLDTWYYELGGVSIEYIYHDDYLLTASEAADLLGISKVTLRKYVNQGLECQDNNGSHKKIPKHAVELMRDAVYAIRMQMNYQTKKKLVQTPQERLIEIIQEVAELQIQYGKRTYQEAFEGMAEGDLEDPIDYYRWEALTEEMDEILKIAGNTKGN
ncbi:Helix-turn-helix domain protein [compost metagenome]